MNKFLLVAAALCFASVVNAADYASFTKNGEYLYVESEQSTTAFPKVVTVFEETGWRRQASGYLPSNTKTDTWCKVKVNNEREILGECYTPRQGHGLSVGRSLAVRDHVVTFSADYSRIPDMMNELSREHRRASVFLGIK